MKTIYNLPNELLEPPMPPTGSRWEVATQIGEAAVIYCTPQGNWTAVSSVKFAFVMHGTYLKAIPLRPVPEGVADVPGGYEYCGKGPLKSAGSTPDCIGYGNMWYVTEHDGSSQDNHYALRIGSKIHFDNIVSKGDTKDETAPLKVAAIAPSSKKGARFVAGNISKDGDYFTFKIDDREAEHGRIHYGRIHIHSNTPDLRDRIISLLNNTGTELEQAIGYIKDILGGADGAEKEARRFLERFAPPFDWRRLWDELPSWIGWVAMDENEMWYVYPEKPIIRGDCWSGAGGFYIPEQFAPPTTDWKTSLVERPKK